MTDHYTLSRQNYEDCSIQLSKILELSVDIICTFDKEGRFMVVSAAAYNIWGYKPEELVGSPFINLVHPEDHHLSNAVEVKIRSGINATNFENRYIRKDGTIVHMVWSAHWDKEQQVMYCIGRDGTEKKLAEHKLQLSEKRFKSLVQDGADMIAILDANWNITYHSPSSSFVLGRQPHELIGRKALDFIHPDDIHHVVSNMQRLTAEKRITIAPFRFRHNNGSYRWVESVAIDRRDDPAVGGVVTNSRDVTERIKAIEQLEENKAKLKLAAEIAGLGYWQHQPDGTNRYWSDEVYNILGISKSTDLDDGESLLEIVYPDDREKYISKQKEYLRGEHNNSIEYRIACPDGSVKWVCETGRKVRDENTDQLMVIGTVQDITNQKLLALSLEESNKRYEYATRASFDAVWDWNIEKDTHYWGEGFEKIFGHSLKECKLHISAWTDYLHPEDLDRVSKGIYGTLAGTETNWADEYRFKKADGTYAYVTDKGIVIRDDKGKAIRMVGAMQDISERKKAERELKSFADELYKRNKELHEFGYIVSHNLRSPVANIMGITQLLEMDKDDVATVEMCSANLKKAVTNLDTVIKDLSNILSATDGSLMVSYEQIDLQEILESVSTDLKEVISRADAVIERPAQSILLLSHKAYLHSIFFNLISNAIKYRSTEQPVIKILANIVDNTILISVQDNGMGINLSKHAEDLFKPYRRFNTHVNGKGLGLFLVKSHIEALNGQLRVESKVGLGSTFTVILPLN